MAKAAKAKKGKGSEKSDQKKPQPKKELKYDKDAYQDQAWERGESIKCAQDESDYSDEE